MTTQPPSLDLNLLSLFHVMLKTQSVQKSAKILEVSPSAVSKGISKLRRWYGDPLFIRTPAGFCATAFALSLMDDLKESLFQINEITDRRPNIFTGNQNFHCIFESPFEEVFLSGIADEVAKRFASSTLKISGWRIDSLEKIISGEADLGVCGLENYQASKYRVATLPYYISHDVLLEDQPCVYVQKDHEALQHEWSLDRFVDYDHVAIEWEASAEWALDDVLKQQGYKRRVTLTVEGFEQALRVAAQPHQRRLVIAPSYCRGLAAARYPNLRVLPIPLANDEARKISVLFSMLWHKRSNNSLKVEWLRRAVKSQLSSQLPTTRPEAQMGDPSSSSI